MLSEENKAPEHCLKLERWQGPPHTNKVKQYEIVFVYSVIKTKNRVCLFSFFWCKNNQFLLWLKYIPPKLRNAPLKSLKLLNECSGVKTTMCKITQNVQIHQNME